MVHADLQIRDFTAADFPPYATWFNDERLNRELGPIDEAWLAYVLNETDGRQLAFTRAGELVGCAGLVLPIPDKHPYYALTDIAVRPNLRGTGVGKEMLRLLFQEHPLQPGERWLCFVDQANVPAQKFFKGQGWLSVRDEPADMLRYEYSTPAEKMAADQS